MKIFNVEGEGSLIWERRLVIWKYARTLIVMKFKSELRQRRRKPPEATSQMALAAAGTLDPCSNLGGWVHGCLCVGKGRMRWPLQIWERDGAFMASETTGDVSATPPETCFDGWHADGW